MKPDNKYINLNLFCEWADCDAQPFNDLNFFLSHLKTHWELDTLICKWSGCDESEFANFNEFQVHLSYHGFHSKLMSIGLNKMKNLSTKLKKDITCSIDASTRTILPALPEMFVCGWKDCLEIFQQAEDFYRHVEAHPFSLPSNGLKLVKCNWLDCNATSNTRSQMRQHLRSHTQEKIIACPGCGAMFSHVGKFTDHLLRQMETSPSDPSIIVEINEEQEITLTIQPSSETAPYACNQCNKSFLTQSLLSEHNRRHFHYHSCDICGQTANSPSAIKHHKRYRHSDERPFKCQFCEAKFKTRSDLRKHIYIHNEENPFKCSLCDFECRSNGTLLNHMKQHQSVNNVYMCHICNKKFTRGNNLTRHLITIHRLSLPPSQSRFTYVRDEEGIYRMSKILESK